TTDPVRVISRSRSGPTMCRDGSGGSQSSTSRSRAASRGNAAARASTSAIQRTDRSSSRRPASGRRTDDHEKVVITEGSRGSGEAGMIERAQHGDVAVLRIAHGKANALDLEL